MNANDEPKGGMPNINKIYTGVRMSFASLRSKALETLDDAARQVGDDASKLMDEATECGTEFLKQKSKAALSSLRECIPKLKNDSSGSEVSEKPADI